MDTRTIKKFYIEKEGFFQEFIINLTEHLKSCFDIFEKQEKLGKFHRINDYEEYRKKVIDEVISRFFNFITYKFFINSIPLLIQESVKIIESNDECIFNKERASNLLVCIYECEELRHIHKPNIENFDKIRKFSTCNYEKINIYIPSHKLKIDQRKSERDIQTGLICNYHSRLIANWIYVRIRNSKNQSEIVSRDSELIKKCEKMWMNWYKQRDSRLIQMKLRSSFHDKLTTDSKTKSSTIPYIHFVSSFVNENGKVSQTFSLPSHVIHSFPTTPTIVEYVEFVE